MELFVSHILAPDSPVYPGNPGVKITQEHEVGVDGAPFRNYVYSTGNHIGTHMDAPAHFVADGLKITELPMAYFSHRSVALVDIPKTIGEGIMPEDIAPHASKIKGCSAVLIRTGFEVLRSSNKPAYEAQCPYFHPDTCTYLIDEFPLLRVIGFDFISLGSAVNSLGVLAHQNLLGFARDQFICCIEDMHLDHIPAGAAITRFTNLPMRIAGIDSCQVTCVLEVA
ncbi:MAG: cyclase family protein [Marinosulfonomonas sp.]